VVDRWKGEPVETDEMKPAWFNTNEIPFERMWQDDKYWLPLVLQNNKVTAEFVFGEDNQTIQEMRMKIIERF
jgi:hypothetical protein